MKKIFITTLILIGCFFAYNDYVKSNNYGINTNYSVSKNGEFVTFGESYIEKVNDGKRHFIDFCNNNIINITGASNKNENDVLNNKDSCVLNSKSFIYNGNKYIIDNIDVPDEYFKCDRQKAIWEDGQIILSDYLIGSGKITAHIIKKEGNVNYIDSLKTENGITDIIRNLLYKQEAVVKGEKVDWCVNKRNSLADDFVDWINKK